MHGLTIRVIETAQTVLTALLLAFTFRAFLIEPFIIPTGSMAPSLLGAHGVMRCPRCGWEFEFGSEAAAGGIPAARVEAPHDLLCPNCHDPVEPSADAMPIKAGDRIVVHKWPYVVGGPLGPKRWDVIVFRDPADPRQNYIKRLVGLPHEEVEIVDGDLFIDGAVARKPAYAQRVLWSPVFDQNHTPPAAAAGTVRWRFAEPRRDGAGWHGLETRVLRYAASDDVERGIVFDPAEPVPYLTDLIAYNRDSAGENVGDVRLIAELTFESPAARCAWSIRRDAASFTAALRADGAVELTMESADGRTTRIGKGRVAALRPGRAARVELGHLDYRVYLAVDGVEALATRDDQYAPDLTALRALSRNGPVELRLSAAGGALELRGLRIDRDVHYTYRPGQTRRAFAGEPFVLGDDEYFVLGDNSPRSHDSREWFRVGPHLDADLREGRYRLGVVRGEQIVGRAFFVYFPGLLPLDAAGRWWIPDVGRMRFVR